MLIHDLKMDELFFCLDGANLVSESQKSPWERASQYGSGLFETMFIQDGKIRNGRYHFERLFSGLKLIPELKNHSISKERLLKEINLLLQKNNHQKLSRVRLMICKNEAQSHPSYLIESFPISTPSQDALKLCVDIYSQPKVNDEYANLKTNFNTIYRDALCRSTLNQCDELMILNEAGNVIESAIANLFIIKGDQIITPPLSEGCVAGTSRRMILEKVHIPQYQILEKIITLQDLQNADEVFLTNAIKPLRSVIQFKNKTYSSEISAKILCQMNELFEYEPLIKNDL